MSDTQLLTLVIGLCGIFITVAGAANGFILNSFVKRLTSLEVKLDSKQDKTGCTDNMNKCRELRQTKEDMACKGVEEIWDAFGTHSHEGLPAGSKVTR